MEGTTMMEVWDKTQINSRDMYVTYGSGPNARFIARFKYNKGPVTKAKFIKQLVKAMSPTQYFAEMEAGKAPLTILIDNDPAWYEAEKKKFLARNA